MRIAVLTSLYPTAARPFEGIFAEERWTRMRRRGHEVRVVQPLPRAPLALAPRRWTDIARAARSEERQGVRVLRPRYWHWPGRARSNARRFCALGARTILAAGRPDVVVADYAWPACLAAAALAEAGLPFFVHGRGSDVLQVAGEAGLAEPLSRALRLAGSWGAVSRDLVARLDELGGAPGRGVLIPNGVDLELFALRDRRDARARLGLTGTGARVLVVGHLIARKDPALALQAFARSSRECPGMHLVFVGRGALERELHALAARLGVGARVEFLGELPPEELARQYAAADVLLLCSRREGRPNVVLEALACGLPVVATDAGGTGELLASIPGALVRTRDPDDVARALLAQLAAPPQPAALRRSVEPLSWEHGLEALERALADAMARAIARGGAAGGAR